MCPLNINRKNESESQKVKAASDSEDKQTIELETQLESLNNWVSDGFVILILIL